IAIPALTAGKWDRVHIDLAAPENDTAIISVGLFQNSTDLGAFTLHIDDVRLDYKYWYMATGETFIQSTIANAYAEFLQIVHGTTPTLYLGAAPNEVRAATDPTNAGSWGTITEIGDHSADITEFVEWQGLLYVMKEDFPYYIDGSGNVQDDVAHELETEKATTSGKNTMIWHNKLYTQAGDQTLLEATTGGVNTFRSPADFITNDSNFTGKIQALAHDTYYLYAIVDNSAKVEILAGRLEAIEGTTEWVWHPIQEITLAGCETAYVSTVVQKRMWISSTSSSDALYYLPLPATYGNIESDANASFKTGGYFETPWLHGDFRSESKAWIKMTLTMGHSYNANDYFTVKYKKLGDSSWTTIGDFAGNETSMIQTKFIDTTGKPFSPMMKFQFTGVTGSTSRTPVLLNYDIRAVMYPPIRKLIHCVVRCADEILTNDGMVDKNMYDRIKATLDNARNNAKWAIPIKDIVGDGINVKFLPVPRSLQRMLPTKKEKGRRNQEREYHLLMLGVPLS
ncbi:hypothetical protein LCGC14_2081970, partial [marine sediment metagenome]